MKARQLILTALLILCASNAWAMRPGFWGAIVAGEGGPAGATLVLDDSLTEASEVQLTAHTVAPGPGDEWLSPSTEKIRVDTVGMRSGVNTNLAYSYNDIGPYTNLNVEILGTTGFESQSRVFGACKLDSSINGYCATLRGDGAFYVDKIVAGVRANLYTVSTCGTHSVTTTYKIELITTSESVRGVVSSGGNTDCDSETIAESTYPTGSPGAHIIGSASRILDIKAYAND